MNRSGNGSSPNEGQGDVHQALGGQGDVTGGEEVGRGGSGGLGLLGLKMVEAVGKFGGVLDVDAWLAQVEVTREAMEMSWAKLVTFFPLLLKDQALRVWHKMDVQGCCNYGQVSQALLHAFADDQISAHNSVQKQTYVTGEGVDTFAIKIRRLGNLAKANDDTIRMHTIMGLPRDIADKLR